ncbi:MAG: homoserine kinase [Anaerolineae bacterium]|nr:homoserine kinase [Anaerolineae bacterium]MCO5191850.1 homoserine kinase [Anaerolineae bacterium]MCO5197666.1 homoserine kinase [Anaerolineae bacterium]
MNSVKIIVPATTANLGPGFDSIGMALALYNEITFTPLASGLEIDICGEGASQLPRDASNLVYEAAQVVFNRLGNAPTGLCIQANNAIPVGSGLGSSSAAIIGGMAGANALLGSPLDKLQLLELAAEIEGHTDNIAPALFGRLTMGLITDGQVFFERLDVPPLTVVVVLPDFHILTSEARAALPDVIPYGDAVYNIGRIPFVLRALQNADYNMMSYAMRDRLHEPYRFPLIPGMDAATAAARNAGAAAVVLSGAGPSLIAFAPDNHQQIANAARDAFAAAGFASRTFILGIDTEGTRSIVI